MVNNQASCGGVLSNIDSYYLVSACSMPGIVRIDCHVSVTPLPGGYYHFTNKHICS